MRIKLLGTNFRLAPLPVRERLARSGDRLEDSLAEVLSVPGVGEAVLLSTCNRVELIYVDGGVCAGDLEAVLARWAGIPPERLSPHLLRLDDEEAVHHVFRVCSSLDSMVLGETQINGQVKESYRVATETSAVGPVLHRLLHKAFSVAKRVRTETGVGTSAISVAGAAVELASRVFDQLQRRPVLLLGAGEMGELALRGFVNGGCDRLWVSNRTLERAVELAERHNAAVLPWHRRVEFLTQADVVLCSTAAGEPVLTRSDVASARRARRGRPLFLIDISVPRNLDPEIGKLDWVYLFDVDDLDRAIEGGREARQREADRAEALVDEEVSAFRRVLSDVHVAPLLKAANLKVQGAIEDEVQRTLKRLGDVTDRLPAEQQDELADALRSMGRALGKRFLGAPIGRIKELGQAGEREALAEASRLLGVEATLLGVRQSDADADADARDDTKPSAAGGTR